MSHTIVQKYVATTDGLDAAWSKPVGQQDKQFKNQTLCNQDELLYIDLCQAMNTGDIRRVEASFLPWIYIFKAISKHKYSSQISRFLNNLQFNWPESLRYKLVWLDVSAPAKLTSRQWHHTNEPVVQSNQEECGILHHWLAYWVQQPVHQGE